MKRYVDTRRLADLIAEAGLSCRQTAKSWVFTCPLCRKEGRLYISKTSGRMQCMKCAESNGMRGAPEFALKELTGRSLRDLRLALYGTEQVAASLGLDIKFDDLLDDDEEIVEEIEPELPEQQWPYYCLPLSHKAAGPGRAYLERRGVSLELAAKYDLRYSPQDRSVAIPAAMSNRLLGWQMRTIDPTEILTPDFFVFNRLKIMTYEIPRERVVMFADKLLGSEHAVICEGPFDAIKADLVGGNVATMGKEISQGQISALLRSGVSRFYLALDPDAASTISPLLDRIGDMPASLVEIPPNAEGEEQDLGALSLEEARDVILSAKPIKRGRVFVYFKDAHLFRRS
jgi:hypothetical protein